MIFADKEWSRQDKIAVSRFLCEMQDLYLSSIESLLDALASLELVMTVGEQIFHEIFDQPVNKTLRHTDFQI